MPTIKPKSPIAEPKISIIRIFTKRAELAASARAAPEPTMPTAMPQKRLTIPTDKPAPNITYPAIQFEDIITSLLTPGLLILYSSSIPDRTMAVIKP